MNTSRDISPLIFIGCFIVLSVVTTTATYFSGPTKIVDARTMELCQWYATRDHQKEIAPERWEKNGKWEDFDWYTSCINHERYPTVSK